MHGLHYASGSYISIIDADLQQDPEIVRNMVNILEEKPDIDVVAAYQAQRHEGKHELVQRSVLQIYQPSQ